MLLAINPATIAVLPVAAVGCYLLYKLWAPQAQDDTPSIEVLHGQQVGVTPADWSAVEARGGNAYQEQTKIETQPQVPLPSDGNMYELEKEAVVSGVTRDLRTEQSDFTLEGLFVDNKTISEDRPDTGTPSELGHITGDVRENMVPSAEPLETPREDKVKRRQRNKLAKFPFDIRVWEDPGTPRSVARAQRIAERAEKRAAIEETRVAVTDVVSGGGGSVVLESPIETPREMFADVWQLASGETAPDAMSGAMDADSKSSRRAADKAAKRAEKDERKLERLRSKEAKKQQKEAEHDTSDSFMETEDPWVEGAGDGAFLTSAAETEPPAVWSDDQEIPLPETWDLNDADLLPKDTDADSKSSRRAADKAAKRAEKDERKLERLRSKEAKKQQKEAEHDTSDSFMETEDPWVEGAGDGAFLTSAAETEPPAVWSDDQEIPLPETWEIGGEGEGMGDRAITWAEAAAVAGPIVPSATMISGDELLDIGSSIVIGTEPGAGDGAFYLPEGFETVVEDEPRRRIRGRRRRTEGEDESGIESVADWAQGGVVLDPDEGVNYQEYDIPEPIPSRTVVIFGESEEP